ncbi:MAG: hypothetical protein SW019_22745, partial [Actinomycetota bacterium]|nr:hypothetical protein [Actinomycetota bacterium]
AKGAPAREPRRAADRRAAYDRAERPDRERAPRPQQRRPRYEGFEGYQTFGGYDGIGGMGGYEGYEPPREPRRERGNGTHHPVSRVRYRGGEDGDDRAEYRTRRRDPRDSAADRWEYDI